MVLRSWCHPNKMILYGERTISAKKQKGCLFCLLLCTHSHCRIIDRSAIGTHYIKSSRKQLGRIYLYLSSNTFFFASYVERYSIFQQAGTGKARARRGQNKEAKHKRCPIFFMAKVSKAAKAPGNKRNAVGTQQKLPKKIYWTYW